MELITIGLTNFPDGLRVGSNTGATALFVIGSGTVAVTAGQLNTLNTNVVASGTGLLAATGSGTISTGLGGALTSAVANIRNPPGAGGGTTFGYVGGSIVGTSGQVIFSYWDSAGVLGTATQNIFWIATGTA